MPQPCAFRFALMSALVRGYVSRASSVVGRPEGVVCLARGFPTACRGAAPVAQQLRLYDTSSFLCTSKAWRGARGSVDGTTNRFSRTLASSSVVASTEHSIPSTSYHVEVSASLKGGKHVRTPLMRVATRGLYEDAHDAVRVALQVVKKRPGTYHLSLVLCDDSTMRRLNKRWRGKDSPTDVLSLALGGWDADAEPEQLPVELLGDVIVSLDTASRQAAEGGRSLRDEARVLLVHGALHLLGLDHERGPEEHLRMAQAEQEALKLLGWAGEGLCCESERGEAEEQLGAADSAPARAPFAAAPTASAVRPGSSPLPRPLLLQRPLPPQPVRLLALDLDGTLLDSRGLVRPESAEAVQAARQRGVRVVLATGKTRWAATAALRACGLSGPGGVVHAASSGVFLQGLTTYDESGACLAGATLDADVVMEVFARAGALGLQAVGFFDDQTVTLEMGDRISELHLRYYEPAARLLHAVELRDVLRACGMRKMVVLADPEYVTRSLVPEWTGAPFLKGASLMRAVEDALEIVPGGWSKWHALGALMGHWRLAPEDLMAVGDGGNDLDMVRGAGVGVAMGNAVPEVKAAATAVVADSDSGGVAEAIERFVLERGI